MISSIFAQIGARCGDVVERFGDWCVFCARTLSRIQSVFGWKTRRLLLPQMYAVGTLSIPVVMITGAFIGAVLAVQTVMQFKAIGQQAAMGSVINLSVLRELGPVLAGVLLAGRVGGGLTAELGTMRVTEQIDALRAMGADPIRVLVMPRFLACVLMIPVLVFYADFMGILGGYAISVYVYGTNGAEFWRTASDTVTHFDMVYGPIKSIFFGAVLAMIACYKGFHCPPGAAGVGKACTEGFVASTMAVLGLDFFLGIVLNIIYESIYGIRLVL